MTRSPPRKGPPADIERALSSLASARVEALRRAWADWFDDDPPPCQSAELLRHLIAWRLQEERYGGLPSDAKRRLRQLRSSTDSRARSNPPVIPKPGTMITREWRGIVQRVHVLENGFAYEGKHFGSLSRIARQITGKRWSGPRFFGLEANRSPAAVANPQPAIRRHAR